MKTMRPGGPIAHIEAAAITKTEVVASPNRVAKAIAAMLPRPTSIAEAVKHVSRSATYAARSATGQQSIPLRSVDEHMTDSKSVPGTQTPHMPTIRAS